MQFKAGSFTGTGAALNLEIGFVPDFLILFNGTDGDVIQMWWNGMGAADAAQIDTEVSLETSNGIDAFEGEAPNKVLTGTVALTDGSTAIAGTNTSFLTELKAGDVVKVGDQEVTVASVTNATTAVATAAASGSESTQKATRLQGRNAGVTVGTTLSEAGDTIRYAAFKGE